MNTDKIYAESIANEYSVKRDSKVVALKKLDRQVKRPPLIAALAVGIISTLLLGTGMCFVMGVIGESLTNSFALGIALGIVGIAGVSVNYPIYMKNLESRKSSYAGDIMHLAKEITNEE